MNQETKAKVKQIVEIISIYQTSIEGADRESIQLLREDLINKEQELAQIKQELEQELEQLYKKASAIDPEVNQLENEKQEVENALEDIADLLLVIPRQENIELEKEDEEKTEQDFVEETEIIEEPEEIEEEIIQEEQEIEEEEAEALEIEEEEEEILEEASEETSIEEPMEENLEEEKMEKETDDEVLNPIETNIVNYKTLKITEPSKTYKKIAQTIVDTREKTIENPVQALEDGIKMAEELLQEIKKNFQPHKQEDLKKQEQAS